MRCSSKDAVTVHQHKRKPLRMIPNHYQLLAIAVLTATASIGHAANVDWDGSSSGDWSDATNWTPAAPTSGANDVLRFRNDDG